MDYPWLQHPHIQALLNKIVDRLDGAEARGSVSAQTMPLNASTWPALFYAPLESDKEFLWEQFIKLAQAGWFQVTPDAARQSSSGYDKQPRVRVLDIEAVRQATGRPERQKTAIERWRQAIDAHLQSPDSVRKAAGDYCIDMPDRSMDEIVQKLNGLKALADSGMLLREVSSRLFWGMSKILDSRAGLVTALLELDECPFPESPIQLQVFIPLGGFSGVLFIENLMTFEQATRSKSDTFKDLALVYASGFKGSAQRLRTREHASLYFSHKGSMSGHEQAVFENWLFDIADTTPVYFWGDLDWSGMRILKAMRATMPSLEAWTPGYSLMLESLVGGHGHSPEAADKKGQRPLESTGCFYADSVLIPAIQVHGQFVDQELLSM